MANRLRNSKAAQLLVGGTAAVAAVIAAERFEGSDPGLPVRAPDPWGHSVPEKHLPDPMRDRETDCTIDANNYFDNPLRVPYAPSDPIVPLTDRKGESSQPELVATNAWESRPREMSDALNAVEDVAAERMFTVFREYCDRHDGTFEGSEEEVIELQIGLTQEMLRMIDEKIETVRTMGKELPDAVIGGEWKRQWIIEGNVELFQGDRRDYERLLDELRGHGAGSPEDAASGIDQLV